MSAPQAAPISVVIPAHNEERYIEAAIGSVLNQTVPVSEIIVVADDCADRTEEIAGELGAIVLRHSNRSMAMGLNLGVEAATQPFIAFLDADDYWHAEKIENQWNAFSRFPAAAIASCDTSMIYDDEIASGPPPYAGERWQRLESIERSDQTYFIEHVDGQILLDFFILTPTVIVRRTVFSEVGGFDESLLFGQALEFFARVLARHSMVFIEKQLAFHRRHDRNHTNNIEAYRTTYISIIDRMLKHPERYPPGTGRAFRERLKRDFYAFERGLSRERSKRFS